MIQHLCDACAGEIDDLEADWIPPGCKPTETTASELEGKFGADLTLSLAATLDFRLYAKYSNDQQASAHLCFECKASHLRELVRSVCGLLLARVGLRIEKAATIQRAGKEGE